LIASLLIANRGEIARRIIRTARRLGVRTVAVFSDADTDALHVRDADAAVHLGPSPAAESYLRGDKIIAAAKESGAEAIHPGYGFLSENADFAQAVIDAGLIWVGPPPAAIRAMGLKDAAKSLMASAGVPVTPGYLGEDQSPERLAREAAAIGYPVLIKAVAGGGGKGMRKVATSAEFDAALSAAKREAKAAFGDDRVLLETYVSRPRHIEVQVFGDTHGNVVHLFERDCSLQRRHQKVIEEAPAPGMDEATRSAICDAAVRAAKAVAYEGAGTIEFIADASQGLRADRIWFMEMNTRLQVEHPVTEAVTGVDLVEWQLRVASGEPLPLTQDQIKFNGYAIEARLYAENPAKKFLPSTGKLTQFQLPSGWLRIESAVEEGGEITPFYDPMIAKLITHSDDRAHAAHMLAAACGSTFIGPVKTNAGFLARCLSHPRFIAGDVDTAFIETEAESLATPPLSQESLWRIALDGKELPPLAGFRLNAPSSPTTLTVEIDGAVSQIEIETSTNPDAWPNYVAKINGLAPTTPSGSICVKPPILIQDGDTHEFLFPRRASTRHAAASDGAIRSPMPGRIVSAEVKSGDTVAQGQTLLVLEAMKMEHVLAAPFAGVVEDLVSAGQVEEGQVLARIKP